MDGQMPHKYPPDPEGVYGDSIAWRCAACHEWISTFNEEAFPCTVDWRKPKAKESKMKLFVSAMIGCGLIFIGIMSWLWWWLWKI